MTASSSSRPAITPQSSIERDNAGSMAEIDRLPRAWRDLVNEFGWGIVRDMRADGHRNAAKLRIELEAWHVRRHGAWMAEIPYKRRA